MSEELDARQVFRRWAERLGIEGGEEYAVLRDAVNALPPPSEERER